MKAKDYAAKYGSKLMSNDPKQQEEAIQSLWSDMVNESIELARIRHLTAHSSMGAIIREQNEKWNAIARRVPCLKKDGFKETVVSALK